MAGDWIKMRTDLRTHPKIVRMMSATGADTLRVIGALYAVWSVFDAHSDDGILSGYTPDVMDAVIGWPGFTSAMISVGWLSAQERDGMQVLVAPGYSEHNGATAKRRAEDTERKRSARAADTTASTRQQSVRNLSANDADKKRTREENSINTPLPPAAVAAGGDGLSDPVAEPSSDAVVAGQDGDVEVQEVPGRTGAVSLQTWLAGCQAAGEKPVPPDCAALRYAVEVGLPDEVVALHWAEFRQRHLEPGAKRYRDWRRALLNSLRDNWFRLWRFDGSVPVLTSAGMQARVRHSASHEAVPA